MVHMLRVHNERFDAFALTLGRIGFTSRGFVWASVGGIAVAAAFTGQKTQGTNGALELIASNNGGVVFLILITIGLLCYSSWRFVEGLYGLQIKPDQPPFIQVIRGIVTPFCSCIAYLIFAVTNIISIVNGISDNNNSNITEKLTNNTPGKVALFVIAFFLFVAALMWCVDLIQAKLFQDLDLKRLNRNTPVKVLVVTFAYLGTFGRAILFALLSIEFFRVIFDDDLNGGGFGVALQQLQYNTTARIFLVFFGFLIFLFGCFSVCQAVFKNFFRYNPHYSKDKNSTRAEKLIKKTFSKGVSVEKRFEHGMDKDDDQKKAVDGLDQTGHHKLHSEKPSSSETSTTTPEGDTDTSKPQPPTN